MSTAVPTASVTLLRPFAAVLVEEGVPLPELLSEADISQELYDTDDARVPSAAIGAFLRAAARRTRHPALGLMAARRYDLAKFQLLEYVAASSPNVKAGLSALIRHQDVIADAQPLQLVPYGDDLLLRFMRSAHDTPHCLIDFVVGALSFASLRSLKGSGARINRDGWAWLEYARPANVTPYREFFGGHVRFEAPANGILIPGGHLRLSLGRSNPHVQELLEPKLQEQIQNAVQPRSCADQVRAFVTDALVGGDPSLGAAAAHLRTSRTTLKRRLAAEGVVYSGLVADLRKALSLQHLRRRELSLAEVAHRVGYEDVSAFYKAFKRWTGQNPSEYRAELRLKQDTDR